MTREQVLKRLRHLAGVYGSQKALAEHIGVSGAYLSDVLQGYRQPGPKILKALGIERNEAYRSAK